MVTKRIPVSIQYGTSRDVSQLIDFLPMFISSDKDFGFNHIVCVGVSLGGHATYHVLSDGKAHKSRRLIMILTSIKILELRLAWSS